MGGAGPWVVAKVVANPPTFASDFCDGIQRELRGQRARSTARPGVPPTDPRLIVSLMFYICERSLSRNRRVGFYETIFGCTATFR